MYRASVAPSLYAMPKPPKIPQSVLVVIHTPALDVLLIRRADHADFWQSVTGSKDQLDEPFVETATREVAEETGIVVGSTLVPHSALFDWQYSIEYEIYPQFRHRYAEGVIQNTEHWFSLEVPEQLEVTRSRRAGTPRSCGCPMKRRPRAAFVVRGDAIPAIAETARWAPEWPARGACPVSVGGAPFRAKIRQSLLGRRYWRRLRFTSGNEVKLLRSVTSSSPR